MDCRQKENLNNCPCTWPNCPRKGICCECLHHHLVKNELPACYFSKKSEALYDRSIAKFIKEQK